jgi:nitrile hydratase
MRYLALPLRPAGIGGPTEAELADLVTRDSMIGVGLPRQAQATPG